MNKAKIMLMAIAVVAIAGGTLAFKKWGTKMCLAPTTLKNGVESCEDDMGFVQTCRDGVINYGITTDVNFPIKCYILTSNTQLCQDKECTNLNRVKPNN
jgi:hypothetical protein